MKLVRWKRFTWDLAKLPPLETARLGALDSAWSDSFTGFREWIESHIDLSFTSASVPALVVTHGQRIIAASAIVLEVDAESHLISGPCVRIEYRNRGIGTALLLHSLKQLQQGGLSRGHGITKDTAATCKFVYPKFGSTSEAYEFDFSPVSP
jgi:hypothetical protein